MAVPDCLLFDSDGTLVDSEYLCNQAIAQKFAELGVSLNVDDLVRQFRGGKMNDVLAKIAVQHDIVLPDTFLPDYRILVNDLFKQELQPVTGIVEALSELPQPKAIVSNGPRAKIDLAVNLCQIQHFFNEDIFSAYDVGYYKPDPRLYLHAAEMMGFAPQQCVVIEDSLTGVAAGVQARMTTLFYNKYDDMCLFPGVIEFQDMRALPTILETLQ